MPAGRKNIDVRGRAAFCPSTIQRLTFDFSLSPHGLTPCGWPRADTVGRGSCRDAQLSPVSRVSLKLTIRASRCVRDADVGASIDAPIGNFAEQWCRATSAEQIRSRMFQVVDFYVESKVCG